MNSPRMLRHARRKAGLTQRQLSRRSGVPQATIARIESGTVSPRMDTMQRLLAACGLSLQARPALGIGIDRSVIRELRALDPAERLRTAVSDSRALETLGL